MNFSSQSLGLDVPDSRKVDLARELAYQSRLLRLCLQSEDWSELMLVRMRVCESLDCLNEIERPFLSPCTIKLACGGHSGQICLCLVEEGCLSLGFVGMTHSTS